MSLLNQDYGLLITYDFGAIASKLSIVPLDETARKIENYATSLKHHSFEKVWGWQWVFKKWLLQDRYRVLLGTIDHPDTEHIGGWIDQTQNVHNESAGDVKPSDHVYSKPAQLIQHIIEKENLEYGVVFRQDPKRYHLDRWVSVFATYEEAQELGGQ